MDVLIALREDLINFIIFVLIFFAALSIGSFIFDKFSFNRKSIRSIDRFIFSAGLGFGTIGYLVLAIGYMKLLYKHVAYFILILLLALGIYLNRHVRLNLKAQVKKYSEKFLDLSVLEKILILFILIVSCLNLIAALAPLTGQDVLSSYMAIPKIFLEKHSIFQLQENFISNIPILPSYIYLFGLMLHSGIIGQLIHWSFSILGAITLYALTGRYSRKVGLLSSAIFLSLQPVVWESSRALTDLASVFFLLLAFYAFTKWLFSEDMKWMILSGLTGGITAACKGFGPMYIGPLVVLILINLLVKGNLKKILKIEIIFLGSFLAIAAVWYIKAYIATGNPFFPAFFGGRGVSQEWLQNFNEKLSLLSPSKDLKSFLLFPIDLTFLHEKYGGWISPLFLTFIPLIITCKEKADKVLLNIFGYCLILFSFIAFLRINFYLRHFIIFFSLLSIPVSIVIRKFIIQSERKLLRVSVLIVIFVWLVFSFSYIGWKNISNFPPVIGIENQERYLSRKIPEDANFIEAFKYINENLPQDAKILFVGSRGYYLDRDYVRFWRLSTGLLNNEIVKDSRNFLSSINKLGITHILIDYEVAGRYSTGFNNRDGKRFYEYLNKLISSDSFPILYQINSCYLYQI